MSQEKVDRYKEQKRNRDKLIRKEKREWMVTKLALLLVAVVLVVWVGVSAYGIIQSGDSTVTELPSYTLNTTALDDYLDAILSD